MAEHAVLSPSSGEIWMHCTPAPRLAEKCEKKESEYADEGTACHELGELLINRQLRRIREQDFKVKLALLSQQKYYSKGMLNHAENYCTFVMSVYAKALKIDPKALIFVEKKINLSRYIPKSFGTADIIIVCTGYLWFIDLKYGQGVQVSAQENIQLKCYALGAIDLGELIFPDIEHVSLTIFQPRLNHIDTFETCTLILQDWAEKELIPKAKLAWEGKGEFIAGEHCRFCAAKPTCKANATFRMQDAKKVFKLPTTLSDEEISDILMRHESLINWSNSVKEYALKQAIQGKKWPGFKLVEGKSDRCYSDVSKVVKKLKSAGYSLDEIYQEPKIKGIGALEDLLGSKDFNYYLHDLLIKPDGAPTLVVESDKREPYRKTKAIKRFKNEN